MFIDHLEPRRLLAATLGAGRLHITGTDHSDLISIRTAGKYLIINDNGKVRKFKSAAVDKIQIETLAGNDHVRFSDNVNKPATIDGGAGNDILRSGAGADNLIGGDGNEQLSGAGGNDTADGGAGDDSFPAAPQFDGNDTFTGGEGRDTIDYAARSTRVVIGLANGADTPEDATDATMEVFAGGRGDDSIVIGAQPPNPGGLAAYGRDGNDVLISRSGANFLGGGRGNDNLDGMFGACTLEGNDGNDHLRAFKGTDELLRGGSGDDTFENVEGVRTDVHGGEGFDTVDCRAFSFNTPDVTFDDVANDRISIIELDANQFSNVHSDVEKALGPGGVDTVNGG